MIAFTLFINGLVTDVTSQAAFQADPEREMERAGLTPSQKRLIRGRKPLRGSIENVALEPSAKPDRAKVKMEMEKELKNLAGKAASQITRINKRKPGIVGNPRSEVSQVGMEMVEVVEAISAELPRDLVPEASLACARRVLNSLPGAFSLGFFETRLQEGGQADFGFCVMGPSRGEGWKAIASRPGPLRSWWRPVRNLIRQWKSGGLGSIPFHWLEFDAANAQPGSMGIPGIISCLDPDFGLRPFRAARTLSGNLLEDYAQAIQSCLPLPSGGEMALRRAERILRCLPPGGRLLQAGVMCARSPVEIKLHVRLPHDQVEPFLRRIGHPCRGEAIALAREVIFPVVEYILLDLSVGDKLSPRVGFEVYPSNALASGCLRVLRAMTALGFCPPGKARSLRRWAGHKRVVFPGHGWPTFIEKWFALKLVCRADGRAAGKAYLGYRPQFFLFH